MDGEKNHVSAMDFVIIVGNTIVGVTIGLFLYLGFQILIKILERQ